jgi:signal transduction histidine kinase
MKYSRIILIAVWIGLTTSMATWWLIFGLKQIEKNSTLAGSEILRGERMLHWEGGFLILLLLFWGLALLTYSLRDFKRNNQVKEFFATLTHELKTPLASLRLQVESLQEDLHGTEHASLIERLVGDSSRLELQLENALFLASQDGDRLHLEKLNARELTNTLKQSFPELEVLISSPLYIKADTRALEGVLKNLIQNAKIHGQASIIKVKIQQRETGVALEVEDNGRGFSGDLKQLGKLFKRHTPNSGSGIGLYLAKTLTEKMNGQIQFESTNVGFTARITLQGGPS